MRLALLLVVVFALFPLGGAAGEKQVGDVKELAGIWQGWVTRDQGRERATMIVTADGSYRATTTAGSSTEGKFYLQDGKLRRLHPALPFVSDEIHLLFRGDAHRTRAFVITKDAIVAHGRALDCDYEE